MHAVPASTEELRRLVEEEHGGSATLVYVVPVRQLTGNMLWESTVSVFELRGQTTTREVYAWTCPYDGKNHSMMKSSQIEGPSDAVRLTLQASGWWGPNFDPSEVLPRRN